MGIPAGSVTEPLLIFKNVNNLTKTDLKLLVYFN